MRELNSVTVLQDICYQYWYFVKSVSIKNCNAYVQRNLKVTSEKDGRLWNVIQLQVTDWPQDGVVREPRTVLQVIDDVIHRQQKIGGGPVVVHCR